MFPLTLDFGNSTILTRFSLSFYTSLLLKLLVVEQGIVLSAVVGYLLLGLDTNVRNGPFFISVIPDFRWFA